MTQTISLRYAVAFYNGTTLVSKFFLDSVSTDINMIDEFVFSDGKLFLLFTSSLHIYQIQPHQPTLTTTLHRTFPKTPKQSLDLHLHPNPPILYLSINQTLYRYNLTSQQFLTSYNFINFNSVINSITPISG